jgi:hypothetical protein
MSNTFEVRVTHALLMAIIVILCERDPSPTIFGEIGKTLHAPFLIAFCILWAWGSHALLKWVDRKATESKK